MALNGRITFQLCVIVIESVIQLCSHSRTHNAIARLTVAMIASWVQSIVHCYPSSLRLFAYKTWSLPLLNFHRFSKQVDKSIRSNLSASMLAIVSHVHWCKICVSMIHTRKMPTLVQQVAVCVLPSDREKKSHCTCRNYPLVRNYISSPVSFSLSLCCTPTLHCSQTSALVVVIVKIIIDNLRRRRRRRLTVVPYARLEN